MKVLSLQELAKIQNELEEKAGKLVAEVSKRAAIENVPPEEVWIQVRTYRQKLYSTDDPEPRTPTHIKDIIPGVIENIRKRGKRRKLCQ